MSHRTFEVIAVEFDEKYVEVCTDEHGSTSTERRIRHTLRAKCIGDVQARSGATQLYALAGVCFVPLLVDVLWFFKVSDILELSLPRIKMVSTPCEEAGDPRDEVLEKEEKARRKKELCWKYGIIGGISFNPFYTYNERSEEPERIRGGCSLVGSFVACIIGIPFGVAHAAIFLVLVLVFILLRPILWITECLRVLLPNLLYVATCSPTFQSCAFPLPLTKTLADDASHWELNGTLSGTTPFPENMKAGDKFQVAFGPIESACLFQDKVKVVEAS